MTKEQLFSILDIEDLMDLPDRLMQVLLGDIAKRDRIFGEFLEVVHHDLSEDWFLEIYAQEMAQRKKYGQDFSPPELGVICSKIIDSSGGTLHEPTAGNGSLVIAEWWQRCRKCLPWEFFPSQNMVTCWELSARSVPILLFNMSIRGIMGYVYHGDVLEKTVRQKYILINRRDDPMAFSDVVKADINAKINKEL